MDILHIFKTKPDQLTEHFANKLSENKKATTIHLFSEDIDWGRVVDSIFSHKKIITWW